MKKKSIIYTSYITFILALAFGIDEHYFFAATSAILSLLAVSLILFTNKEKVHFNNSDFVFFIIQIGFVAVLKKSFMRISNMTLLFAVISVIYNSFFFQAVNTLSKKTRSFIYKSIGYGFSFAFIIAMMGFAMIAFCLKLTTMVSIGYLYLLVINYIPLLFHLIKQLSNKQFRSLIFA